MFNKIVLNTVKNNNFLVLSRKTYAIQSNVQQKNIEHSPDPEWSQAQPFSKIPGPSKFQMIRSFLPGGKSYGLSLTQLHATFREEYGSISKIPGMFGKPDIVMAFDPNDFEKIFRTEGQWPVRNGFDTFIHYRHSIRPDIFKGNGGLLSEQGENWQTTRTKVNPVMLPPKIVKMYIPHVDEVTNDFINKIKSTRDQNNELPANFGDELNKWSLESIAFIALDQRLGVLLDEDKNPEAKRVIQAVRSVFTYAYKLDVLPSIWKYYKTSAYKKLMHSFDELTEVIMKYVDIAVKRVENMPPEIAASPDHQLSVLEKLLQIDRHVAIVMANDMLMAGIDTTSAAVIGCLYNLAKNQDKQEKLRQEIQNVLSDKNSKLTSMSLNNVPYLRACIKESLRLSPVVAGNFRAAGKDTVLKGYQIPKGIDVAMGSVILHRDSIHFPDPDKFMPERWLKDNVDSTCPSAKSAHPFIYLPFGFGARSCIGKRFAEMEIQVLLIRLLQDYKIEWNYGPIKYANSLIIQPTGDLKFKLTDLSKL